MRRIHRSLAMILAAAGAMFTMAAERPTYPPSHVKEVVDTVHGKTIVDPFRWLEAGDSPDVAKWTAAQNEFARKFLDQIPGRDKIRERLNQLLDTGSISPPRPTRGKYFYTRREGKQNQPVLLVRDGLDGKDRVVLDPNALAADGTVAVDWWFPSQEGRYLAYGISPGGSEHSTLRIRDVAANKDLSDVIERTRACSLAWLPDSSGFYYTRYPKPGSVPAGDENYNRRVFFHKLGDNPDNDTEIFGSGRPKEDWPNIHLSPDGRWLVVVQQQGWAKTEVYFRDNKAAKPKFQTLVEKVDAIFEIDAVNDAMYVRTNDKAPRYKLYKVDYTNADRSNWKEIIPQGDDVLENVVVVGQWLITGWMHNAHSRLSIHDREGKLQNNVALPGIGTVAGLGAEADGKELFFGFQSFTSPISVYRVDLPTYKTTLWDRIKSDIPFDEYEVKQVTFKSKDGTPVTMFIAGKKGFANDGKNPTILYGYGGFNISMTPSFSAARFVFLERGGVIAIANLRGGGEYGEAWHQAGMKGNKQNVFDDFIGAAEWLIKNNVTNPDKLAIQGGSNGGLLVGAVMTQRPDLFRAVHCAVPLLDMVRYHKFLIARLWIPEYGSAENEADFKWLEAYSPYHRVQKGTRYPALLITTAESDTRVDPLHARKFAALLQYSTGSDRPILVRIETKAGHGAGKPRSKSLDELTDVYSFLFSQLGVKP